MTINCKGQLIDLTIPKIMGILNLTPDSFYDGGTYKNDTDILKKVEKMLNEGADFIDIGAYSSRSNAVHIAETEELQRLLPIVKLLTDTFPDILISIDTFRSEVAKQSMTKEILFYFSERIAAARALGIIDIIVDPGFGFSKTTAQNYELLNNLELFKMLEAPLLVGVSRKSMIYKLLGTSPADALNGTTVINTIALQKNASILRVHDVKEAKECIELTQQLKL